MKIDELISTRRTIHQYKPEKVPDDVVVAALEMALWAPNHKMTLPWRFVIVGAEARGKIAALAARLKSKKKGLSQVEEVAVRATYMLPSHLVVLAMKKNPDVEMAREDYATVAMGVQNAALFLWAHGVGSKWTTGQVTTHETVYELVGSHLHDEEIVGFLWVGIPDRPPECHRGHQFPHS